MDQMNKNNRKDPIIQWLKDKFSPWFRRWGILAVLLLEVNILAVCLIIGWYGKGDSEESSETEQTTETQPLPEEGTETADLVSVSSESMNVEETETEPLTEETDPSNETVVHKRFEFEVDLPAYPDRYVISVKETVVSDGAYCIRGEKIYGGDLLISYDQKAFLDYGAVMRVTYEGEEVIALVSELVERDGYSYIQYVAETGEITEIVIRPFYVSRMETTDPAQAQGYFQIKGWGGAYNVVLEEEYQLTVPADTPVYVVGVEEALSMEAFYELAGTDGMAYMMLQIYVEGGEVVKIVQEYWE